MRFSVVIYALFIMFSLSACVHKVETAGKRFFWPLPVHDVEPKIEYLGFYQANDDLQKNSSSWVEEVVLGKLPPIALFDSPYGVSTHSGKRIFVSDTVQHKVVILDLVNEEVRDLKNEKGKTQFFVLPLGVYETADGEVFVVDSLKSKIHKFGSDEKLIEDFGDDKVLTRPVAITVDEQSKLVYVLDTGAHNVVVFDYQGNLLYKFGERGSGPGQFNFPTDIDLDQEGNIYVLDALNFRVQVLDSSGDFVRAFGEQGTEAGSFRIPKGLAVSPQGHVYVTDSLSHRYVIFDQEGNYLLTLGDKSYALKDGKVSPGGFFLPRDIEIDANSSVWVVDGLNKMVHHFQYLTKDYLERFPVTQENIYFPPRPEQGKQ